MSEIRCPRCGGANVVGLEAHPIKLVRYCKDCHDYIANWQQTELSALRDQVQSTQSRLALAEAAIDAVIAECTLNNFNSSPAAVSLALIEAICNEYRAKWRELNGQ